MFIEITKCLGNNNPSNKEGILVVSVPFWVFWHATYDYLSQLPSF